MNTTMEISPVWGGRWSSPPVLARDRHGTLSRTASTPRRKAIPTSRGAAWLVFSRAGASPPGPQKTAVVVVPGWLSDCSQYEPMASHLRSEGLQTVIVPLKWYNWIPSLGGRSVRPILDRIDATISLVLNKPKTDRQAEERESAKDYTFTNFMKEFLNPKNGAQGKLKMLKEPTLSQESFTSIVLVAHSAGGWICRILLGDKVPYDGWIYSASSNVRALVTLGTPHVCTDKLTKRNMEFVNENYPGAAETERGLEYVCVAGKFTRGVSKFGGLWKDFAWQSYELCCGRGDVWGDGVIPLECAIALEGAHHLILEGVEHFPSSEGKGARTWYGSPEIVDKWLPFLLERASMNKSEGSPLNVLKT